jgi:hypothetical protein
MSIPIPLWLALAIFFAALALSSVQTWFGDQYEVTRGARFRLRVTRRWYGTRAHVCLRSAEDDDGALRFAVLDWNDESTPVPWLLVANIDDEDDGPYWAPVSDFAPYTVRRLRPHILRTEHYRFPQLFDYRPLCNASCYLEDVRDAA